MAILYLSEGVENSPGIMEALLDGFDYMTPLKSCNIDGANAYFVSNPELDELPDETVIGPAVVQLAEGIKLCIIDYGL